MSNQTQSGGRLEKFGQTAEVVFVVSILAAVFGLMISFVGVRTLSGLVEPTELEI